MPQSQLLQAPDSFGERLGHGLGSFANQLAQQYQQSRDREGLMGLLGQIGGGSSPRTLTPMQLLSLQQSAGKALGPEGGAAFANALSQSQSTAQKQEKDIRASTKNYVGQVRKEAEAAKLENLRLDRLSELNKKELVTPTGAALAEKLDLPIALFGNPESEEFQKVSQDLLNGIQNTFGSRILQVEVQNFLKTIPTLQNSKEGREKVIKAKKLFNKAKELNYQAFRDIKRAKGLSYDIQDEVIDAVGPELDKLADEFRDVSGQSVQKAPSSPQVSSGLVNVIAPDGTLRRIPSDQLEGALQAGGKPA